MQFERLFVGVFLLGAVEVCDCRAIVIPAEPFVAHAELAFTEFRFLPDRADCTLQDIHIYAVHFIGYYLLCHFMLPPIILNVVS
jgi:hypothetical protein